MAKKEKSKYVVEIIMSQEERDKYAQNPPKRGNLKNWDGKGRVYAKKNSYGHTNTLDLNDATCYNKLEDAEYFAEIRRIFNKEKVKSYSSVSDI